MRTFRRALGHGRRFAHAAYHHGRRMAASIDRTVGHRIRIYNALQPTLVPVMKDLLGEARTSKVHKALTDSALAYGKVRTHEMEADRTVNSIAGTLNTEGVQI